MKQQINTAQQDANAKLKLMETFGNTSFDRPYFAEICDTPLTGAFKKKAVVHAGLGGSPVPQENVITSYSIHYTKLYESDLSAVIEVLIKSPPSAGINTIISNALTMMLEMERAGQEKSPVIRRLLGPSLAQEAQQEEMRFLLLNPGTVSTRIAVYQGLEQVHRFEIHVLPDEEDSIDRRIKAVAAHLNRAKIPVASFDGIACQGVV